MMDSKLKLAKETLSRVNQRQELEGVGSSKLCVSFPCVCTAYNPKRCVDFSVLVFGNRSLTRCSKLQNKNLYNYSN
jgi:hypothetical protein